MKIHYHLRTLTDEEKMFCHYVLLDEMDRQVWYGILVLAATHTEECICVQ